MHVLLYPWENVGLNMVTTPLQKFPFRHGNSKYISSTPFKCGMWLYRSGLRAYCFFASAFNVKTSGGLVEVIFVAFLYILAWFSCTGQIMT